MSYFLDGDVVKSKLEELFPCLEGIGKLECDNFEADFVFNVARRNGINPEMTPISFWNAFQTTGQSFDDAFKALIFPEPSDDYSYMIISDILGEKAVCFRRVEADDIFDNSTDIDFFQPVDYLVVNLDLRKMAVIHHSGYFFTLAC